MAPDGAGDALHRIRDTVAVFGGRVDRTAPIGLRGKQAVLSGCQGLAWLQNKLIREPLGATRSGLPDYVPYRIV